MVDPSNPGTVPCVWCVWCLKGQCWWGFEDLGGSVPAAVHWRNVPSGASLRALPDISRSPTSHT